MVLDADQDMLLVDYIMKTRCRIIVFAISAVGLSIFLLFVFLRPSPSILVSVPPSRPHPKVSVILCRPHATYDQVTSTFHKIKKALLKIEVDHEFFIVSLHLKSSYKRGSSKSHSLSNFHTLTFKGSCAESAYYALEHSHYSVILYISSNLTSYEVTIPKLLSPILKGYVKLSLLDDSSTLPPTLWQRFLYLLLLPITGHVRIPDTPTFAIASDIWLHGCHDIISGRGSLTVDLVSHCVSSWRGVEGLTTPPYEHSVVLLSQVINIWWDSHPIVVCIAVAVLMIFVFLVCFKCYKHYYSRINAKSLMI